MRLRLGVIADIFEKKVSLIVKAHLERRNVAGQKKEGAYNALCKVYKRRVLGS
jgi:hypothetical protein